MSMTALTECKLAKKFQESEQKGLIIGVSIALIIVIMALKVLLLVKLVKMMTKKDSCVCCDDDFDDDFFIDEDDIGEMDENGCCYTNENDFV